LMHTSGQWIASSLTLPIAQDTAQGYGSPATYARRYSLMAIACVAGDEDDDGERAQQTTRRTDTPAKPHQPQKQPTQDEEDGQRRAHLIAHADALMDAQGVSTEKHADFWNRMHERHGNPIPNTVLIKTVKQLEEKAAKTTHTPHGP